MQRSAPCTGGHSSFIGRRDCSAPRWISNATKCAVHRRPLEYFSRDWAGLHAGWPVSHVLPCLARAWGANFDRRARINLAITPTNFFCLGQRGVTLVFALERFAPGTSTRIATACNFFGYGGDKDPTSRILFRGLAAGTAM